MVYIIQNTENGLIKIGKTASLPRRLRQLAVENGKTVPLTVLCKFFEDRDDFQSYNLENDLHTYFAAGRVEGEWFRASKRLLAFVEANLGRNTPLYWERDPSNPLYRFAYKSHKVVRVSIPASTIESVRKPIPCC